MAIARNRLVSIIGGSAGNLVEWYDWFAFASFTLYFSPVFFPNSDQTSQLLKTAMIFFAGFIVRPIGAWIMGQYADRRGRKAGLTLSVVLMFSGSLLLAVAPTYAQVGVLAPVTLLVARMIQGLSLGGEYGASATYLAEMAPRANRGFWSSFQYLTLSGGQLIAILVAVILQQFYSEAELTAWAWRIPFVIGAFLALGVYFIRRRLMETQSFENLSDDRPGSTVKDLLRNHRREFILVFFMTAGGSLTAYTFTSYLQKYLVNTVHFPKATATYVIAAAVLWFTAMQPVFGALADRYGRRPLLLLSGIGVAATAVPIFLMLEKTTSPVIATLLIMIPLTLQSGYSANNALVKAELFPAHIRSLGVALPYSLANAVFAGSVEPLALKLKEMGMERGFYVYVAAVVAVAAIAMWKLPETMNDSQILED